MLLAYPAVAALITAAPGAPLADDTPSLAPPPPATGAAARPLACGDLAVCARVIPATLLSVGYSPCPGISVGLGANATRGTFGAAGALAAFFAAAASVSKLTSAPAAAVSLYASRWYAAV